MPIFSDSTKKPKKGVSEITVKFITLGCKTNSYESDAMAELFRAAGHTVVRGKEPADVCVINTCAVTETGAQKSRRQIRRARRENPDAVLAVTGCLAQIEAENIRKTMGVDILLGNKHRNRIVAFAEAALQGEKTDAVEDILREKTYEELTVTHTQSRVRANLKIEDGCSNFCSYCIIPYARGPVRSRSLTSIQTEAEALGKAGYREVVLTGIHVGSYGKDLSGKASLTDVITAVHRIDGIERIRLGSLEPVLITPEFIRLTKALPKLCPQFHLSLQSGCDATLKRMRRRYTAAEYAAAVGRLKDAFPDVAITCDLMVGFPGETEEEFLQSRDFCRQMGFAQMHIFPYSIRKGTLAATMEAQVPEAVKAERTHEMLRLAAESKEAFYRRFIGRILPVLAESEKSGFFHGTCANYMDVSLPTGVSAGSIIPVLMTDYQNEMLIGIPQEA